MGKIHKITKNGQTIYPATTTDAVVNPSSKKSVTKELTELDNKIYKNPSANEDTILISKAIRELYIPYDGNEWVLAVVSRNSTAEGWVVKAYVKGSSTEYISFKWSENPEGNSGLSLLEASGAYILIDWNELPDGYYKTSMNSDEYLIDSKCFDINYSPIIYSIIKLKDKKDEGNYCSSIYSSQANSSLVKYITGVIKLFVSNTDILETKDLSIASINFSGETVNINFFLSDKNSGSNAIGVGSISVTRGNGVGIYKLYNSSYKLYIQALIDSDNLPNEAKSYMFSYKGYQLNELCFEKYGAEPLVDIYPFADFYNYSLDICRSVKELYIAKGSSEDIRLSPYRIDKENKTIEIKLYKTGVASALCVINSSNSFEGVQVLQFSNDYGYIVIDFDAINNSVSFGNMLDCPLDERCFNAEYSPIIKQYISNNTIVDDEEDTISQNLIYDPTFINIDDVYEKKVLNNTKSVSLQYDAEKKCNTLRYMRVESGYYSGISLSLNYLKPIIEQSQGKYIHFGCIAKKRNATSGTQSNFQLEIHGISTAGWLATFNKESEEWQFTSGYSLINKCDDSLYIQAINYWNNVEDYSLENTFGISVSKFFVAIYDNEEDIPKNINENTYIRQFELTNKPISANSIESLIYKLIERNNFIQLDEAAISALFNRYIGVIPNWNIPHTEDMGFISTDIDNYDTPSDDLSYIRAKAPNFYYNGKRRGCFVLFDENGEPFIFDSENNKKRISLID